jgi:DNA mismatch repair protein MutS
LGYFSGKGKTSVSRTATKAKAPKETPLMGQYNRIKAKYPDAILLFRVGDFYETFGSDAIVASKVLGIVLTKRNNGGAGDHELAGFPHHALDTYLPKLVKAGHRVAICDQLEDPKATKTIVKRGVTELITPGLTTSDQILDHRSNNYLASVSFGSDHNNLGVAFLDVSTGEFLVAEGDAAYLDKLLQGFQPAEVILPKGKGKVFRELFGDSFYTYPLEDWIFDLQFGRDKLLHHFETSSLKGFGVDEMHTPLMAAGAVLHYLQETEHPNIGHITAIARLPEEQYVWLDRFTIRNLELFRPNHEGGKGLIDVLDTTISPMGARLMKRWLMLPLKDLRAINDRLDVVEHLLRLPEMADHFERQLKLIGDLERLIGKVPMGKISPREVVQLSRALEAILPVKQACQNASLPVLKTIGDQLSGCDYLRERINTTLQNDPPNQVEKGDVVRDGVSPELDELRDLIRNGKQRLLDIQRREVENTGIASLKIGFNNVFGYYLEVTNAHKARVPAEWVRKQTLVNAERYITDELKQLEEKIIGAEEKILALEKQIFATLVQDMMEYIRPVQLNAHLIAQIDCLLAFARNAAKAPLPQAGDA